MNIEEANSLTTNNLMGNLGIIITSIDKLTVEATMPVNSKTIQSRGLLHGGATIALAESIAGIGSLNICSADKHCLGIQISANHISSAKQGDSVIAKASIVQKGRTLHVWNIDVFSITTQKLISSIRVTNIIVENHAS